ncbi:hypothetical protein ACB092_03G040900 [Castanea dentata]
MVLTSLAALPFFLVSLPLSLSLSPSLPPDFNFQHPNALSKTKLPLIQTHKVKGKTKTKKQPSKVPHFLR